MATAIVMSISVYKLKLKMKTSFVFDKLLVKTITNKEYIKMFPRPNDDKDEAMVIPEETLPSAPKWQPSEFGYLLIYGTAELESFEGNTYVAAKLRPQLLVVHGILTFLTGRSIMAFESFQGQYCQVEHHIEGEKFEGILKVQDRDHSKDLNKIINTIQLAETEDRRVLIFTLLERWRKAVFLKEESEEVNMHIDEAVLAFFQILEVLADEYSINLKEDIATEKEKLIDRLSKLDNTTSDYKNKVSAIVNLLVENKIKARTKIMNMLKKMGVSNENLDTFIKRYADYRNAIAHGRKNIYQHTMIYPLESFFSFIKDVDEEPELIKLLSATAISKYLELDSWHNEWNYLQLMEQPQISIVNQLVKGKFYELVDTKTFFKSGHCRLTPYTFFYYYVRGKLKIKEVETVMTKYILEAKITKANYHQLFNCCCILSDTTTKELAIKAQEFILVGQQKKWTYRSEIRDMYHYLDYHGIKAQWLYDWLSKGT